jgi:hypothetical protein
MKLLVSILLTTLSYTALHAQDVKRIVKDIAKVNEVQFKHIGYAGSPSDQYRRFQMLKALASIDELLKLTTHQNNVVTVYASWGLIDEEYEHLDELFQNFLDNDKKVVTYSGTIKSEDAISSQFYYRFWNKLARQESEGTEAIIENHEQLKIIDSIVIYKKDVDWLILRRALRNRVYPVEYLSQIEQLAFKDNNLDAIDYFFKNSLEGNEKRIQDVVTRYLNRVKVLPSEYEVIFEILLSFNLGDLDYIVLKELEEIDELNLYPSSTKYDPILEKYGLRRDGAHY